MKGQIQINTTGYGAIIVETTVFPGGEVKVNIPQDKIDYIVESDLVHIDAWLHDSEMVMSLFMVTDAIRQINPMAPITLSLQYVPYARQDRVCVEGESLSIKVFADLLNAQNYAVVYILDPHSDVTPALINNCIIDTAFWYERLKQVPNLEDVVLVAPDFGATKRVEAIGRKLGLPVVQGKKHRDLETGQISGFGLDLDNGQEQLLYNSRVLILDDICDGGGTFIGLADEIHKHQPSTVELFVTHGIFSGGLARFNDYIDRIYTTGSVINGVDDLEEEAFNGEYKQFL